MAPLLHASLPTVVAALLSQLGGSAGELLRHRASELWPRVEDAARYGDVGHEKASAWSAFQEDLASFLAAEPQMLQLPDGIASNETVVVTSAGKDKLEYVDSAVMLGLSLRVRVPSFPRLCIVQKEMPEDDRKLLRRVGWTLVEVDEFIPAHQMEKPGWEYWLRYWLGSFIKVNAFRLQADRVLYLDSDTYVWSSALGPGLLTNRTIPLADDGSDVGLVEDVNGVHFNSGVMLIRPSLDKFKAVVEHMNNNQGWGGIDQPAVNDAFRGHVVRLDHRYNVHGRHWHKKDCSTVVVSHYTGNPKPTNTEFRHLNARVSTGQAADEDLSSLKCPNLYQAYYCDMLENTVSLSESLREALRSTRDCKFDAERPEEQ